MAEARAWPGGVRVEQDPDAALERAGHGHLDGAEERDVHPPQLPGGVRWKLGAEIGRDGEDHADDVVGVQFVRLDDAREQLARRLTDEGRVVGVDGRRPADGGDPLVVGSGHEVMDPRALALVAITDDLRDGIDGLTSRAAAAVRGGATMVQLRLKHAAPRTLVEVARAMLASLPVPLIINDRADIALAAGAAGVHLGADDLPVAAVRGIAPLGFIIGASLGTEDELENARGADYVGIGSIYGTRTKRDAGVPIGLDVFARLRKAAGLPAVGIGGITADNAAAVVRAGAAGVAAVSAVFGVADPESAARAIRASIGS